MLTAEKARLVLTVHLALEKLDKEVRKAAVEGKNSLIVWEGQVTHMEHSLKPVATPFHTMMIEELINLGYGAVWGQVSEYDNAKGFGSWGDDEHTAPKSAAFSIKISW
ncbi:hypothetical protein [Xanthomonas phage BUDD]|nr:hypothetical protein [Xanthomonas phage BUDD]